MNAKLINIGHWIATLVLGFWIATPVQAQQAQPATAAPAQDKSAPMEAEWSNPLPPGRLNLGIHFGDQQSESFGDILVPVIQFESGLLFVNPRGSWNDSDGQEFNLGLGYRHLFPDREIIIGGNMFYDLRNTSLDNTFNQFGCGLELLSTWVDARVNVYLPESGKKTADEYTTATSKTQERGNYWYAPTGQGHLITQYGYDVTSTYDVKTLQHYQISEQAMDGFDGEIGFLLPIPVVKDVADVKVFAGYYDYNSHYGDDITGMKGRLEIKPMPSLYLDAAWFEDKALLGSKYSVGARLSVPFDLANLSRGKNPFAGAMDGFKPGTAKPPFASRMTEMVVRDLHIRTDMSDPEEVVSDRRILEKKLTSLDRKDFNLVLASGVTFVDDDNRSGVEDGSWENPYRQINTGVQSAIGTMVYVRDAAQQYYENVVLREGLTLWGSGAPIYGQGNRFLGGIYPVVNGMGIGPAITLANHVTVAGFEITQPMATPQSLKGDGINLTGIYGENVTDVRIQQNIFHGGMETGVMLRSYDMPSLVAVISDNQIKGMSGNGIDVMSFNTAVVDVTLANNHVTGSGRDGAFLYSTGGDIFLSRVSGIYSENSGDGVSIQAYKNILAASLFVDTEANGNAGDGINVRMAGNYLAGALFVSHADLERMDALVNTVGGAIPFLSMEGFSLGDMLGVKGLYRAEGTMQANDNGGRGIYLEQGADINLAGFVGVHANENGWNSDRFKTDGGDSGIEVWQSRYYTVGDHYAPISVAAVLRSEANRNQGSGMVIYSEAESLAVNAFIDVRANNNYQFGIEAGATAVDGVAVSVMLASDPLLSLAQNLGQMDTSYIPAFGQNEANYNGASGIALNANGSDWALGLVLDAHANGNGLNSFDKEIPMGNGIDVNVDSEYGVAIGVVGSTEALMALGTPLLAGLEIPLDLSRVQTLGPVQANDNANNGVVVSATSVYGSAIVGIAGVEALRNGYGWFKKPPSGGGITLSALSLNEGDAIAGLAYVNASENFGDGIRAIVSAQSSTPGEAGEAMLGGINIVANGNYLSGLDLEIMSDSVASSYLVLAGVDANRNINGVGIDASLRGEGVAMAALTDIQANGNGSDGISIQTDCYSVSNGNSHVWIAENAVQDMSDHGGGVDLLGLDIISMLPSGAIEADNNGGAGVHVNSESRGNSLVVVGDVAASGNTGNGVQVESTSYDGHGNVYLNGNTTSSNGVNGIQVNLIAATAGTLEVKGNVANGNVADGVHVTATVVGAMTLTGRSNVAKGNDGDGIDMTINSGSVISYDFGTEEENGNNATAGNGDFGMRWSDGSGRDDSLYAQYNYWGGEPAAYASGDIIADPYLVDDPSVP